MGFTIKVNDKVRALSKDKKRYEAFIEKIMSNKKVARVKYLSGKKEVVDLANCTLISRKL